MSSSPPTTPMNIPGRRARSGSESSESSADMAETPGRSSAGSPPRVKIQTQPGVATSPVMSFFFPGSPTKTPGSLFARPPPAAAASPIADDDEAELATGVLPASAHARRFSSSWAKPVPTSPPADDRGAGLLRRLSLSSAFGRPVFPGTHAGGTTPPNTSPVVPKTATVDLKRRPSPSPGPVHGRVRRSATIAVPNPSPPKARAPSPMGERILKGHFDGFV